MQIKIKNFIHTIHQSKLTCEETRQLFLSIFLNEYIYQVEETDTECFLEEKDIYLFKNSNGLSLTFITGEGDRYGGQVARTRTDIHINSTYNGTYYLYIEEVLYAENEMINDDMNYLFDMDLSKRSPINKTTALSFQTLTKETLKQSKEIVNLIIENAYNTIKQEEKLKN